MKKTNKDNHYNPEEVEQKWQKKWIDTKLYSPDIEKAKKPFYNLMMFPYPSAEGLHVGNMYAFVGTDIYGRFQRMQKKDVFEPIGLDGFGIHSENYALKVGSHPMEQAELSEKNFYRQLKSTGNAYDWTRTVETYNPDYYKWTQWLFIELFNKGLAYRKNAPVNFCPSCKTVLADEQVIDGKCERCSSIVEKRDMEQWFFKITDYADRLLENIPQLNWTEKVKIAQKEWIGRSEGMEIKFKLKNEAELVVYTVYPETIFGVTYMVLAPEHPLVKKLTTKEQEKAVAEYVKAAQNKSEVERTAVTKEKTGVFTGSYCINPVNGDKVPVWVADYVIGGYGTGAVMGVPGSDHRDFAFAQKYELPIIRVIGKTPADTSDIQNEADVLETGYLVNSKQFSGLQTPQEAREKLKDFMEKKGFGKRKKQYHLRDWLISRQRYWGPPIPMINCPTCGWQPVPEKELPVLLPKIDDYKPMGTGVAPLASHKEFYETKCPKCKGEAKRETDVSDTFLDSAWYFLRYVSTDIKIEAFDILRVRKWLPVDMYIGGAEHSVLHLLYTRFITMVLSDLGLIDFEEPFKRFYAHGLIIKEGSKMSKSKGNVVVPDQYIAKYGADTLRIYLMFLGPYSQGGDFRDTGIEGMNRFVRRVWSLISSSKDNTVEQSDNEKRMTARTVQRVTRDVDTLHYNTAIAGLMEYYNFLSEQTGVSRVALETFLKLLAPFAPHMTEELWESMGNSYSIHTVTWPTFEEAYLQEEEVTIAIQVNGKVRDAIVVKSNEIQDKDKLERKAKDAEKAKKHLDGKEIKKTIYVEGKIINFVTSV